MTPETTAVAPAVPAPDTSSAPDTTATVVPEAAVAAAGDVHALPSSEVPAPVASPLPPAAVPPAAGPLQGSLQALRLGGQRLAAMLKQRTEAARVAEDGPATAAAAPADGVTAVDKIKATAAGLSARAKEQGTRFYAASVKTAAAAAEGIKRLTLDNPVHALCRGELTSHPVPQLVLVTTNALVLGGGLTTQRIFKHEAPQELVDALMPSAGVPLRLIPPGTSPHALAALLKQFLLGLPEPLLTYRLLPEWVAAADTLETTGVLVRALPPANANVLRLLLQLCALINKEAAVNEMDSQALAEVLLPCLAWKPAAAAAAAAGGWPTLGRSVSKREPGAAAAGGGEGGAVAAPGVEQVEGEGEAGQAADAGRISQLEGTEAEALVLVLEHMIAHYEQVFA